MGPRKVKYAKLKMHLFRQISEDLPFDTKLKLFRFFKKINPNFQFQAILSPNTLERKNMALFWNLEFSKIIRFSEYTLRPNFHHLMYKEIQKIPILFWRNAIPTGYVRLEEKFCSIKTILNFEQNVFV